MRRRHLKWGALGVAAATLLFAGLVIVLTMTQLGRSFVTRIALERLAQRINGDVVIQEVRGNLLTGATLVGLRISDPEGRLFLEADTLRLRYGLRALFRKRLEFSDVRFVSPVVLLNQPPGDMWNYQRIFPADTVLVPGDTVPGFGSWVNLTDVTIVGGTIEVRREWTHPGGHRRVPDPSAFITKMSAEPERPLTNAILEPSTDHAGSTWKNGESVLSSSPSASVSRRSPPPFAPMTKIA